MTYDPRAAGADCDHCPLAGRPVVPPLIYLGRRFLAVAHEPTRAEEEDGRPLTGPAGQELTRAVEAAGHTLHEFNLTLVHLCRTRLNDPKAFGKLATHCCSGRLIHDVTDHDGAVLLLGAEALQAVAGATAVEGASPDAAVDDSQEEDADAADPIGRGEAAISKMRGYPIDILGKRMLATWHPSMVTRKPKWTETFRWDVAKFFRLAEDRLEWREPELIIDPTVDQLSAVLERIAASNESVATDTETAHRSPFDDRKQAPDPETCLLRCVGIGNTKLATAAHFISVTGRVGWFRWRDGTTRPSAIDIVDQPRARERIRNFYAQQRRLVLHNEVYDRPILDRHGMPLPAWGKTFDTLTGHHVVDSELPHGLDFLSSRLTDSPKHKPGGGYHWEDDEQHDRYCCLDCTTTAIIAVPIRNEIIASGQQAVYAADTRDRELCVGMHRAGLYIDQGETLRHEIRLKALVAEAEQRAEAVAGKRMNLGSHDQIRDFLFTECGLRWPSIETDAGLPSTGRDAIHELLARQLPDRVERFLAALLDRRRSAKALDYVNAAKKAGGDGRIHPSWNPNMQVVGRKSASNPAVQQWPGTKQDNDSLRSMIIPAPGNVFVYADMAQLHLRLIAEVAGDDVWRGVFMTGGDAHVVNARDFFSLPNGEKVPKHLREFAKVLAYLYVYAGGAETAMKTVWKVRDPATGIRKYARFTLAESQLLRKRILKAHPALQQWWERAMTTWRSQRWLADLYLGRKKYFKDYVNAVADNEKGRSEIVNYGILALEGSLMGGAGAAGRLMDAAPFGLYGPGIVFHGHDSMMLEVEARHEERAKRIITDAMSTMLGDMPLPAEAKSGMRFSVLS